MTASPAISKTDTYKPLVVEGRTWWYANEIGGYTALNYDVLTGLRIGDKVTIDGTEWNKVEIIMSKGHSENKVEPASLKFEYSSEPRLIAYVREESGTLYVKHYKNESSEKFYSTAMLPWWSQGCDDGDYLDGTVYKFGTSGESFNGGCVKNNVDFTIKSVEDVENSGRSYRKYTAEPVGQDELFKPNPFIYYEGIGSLNGLFFYPYDIWIISTPHVLYLPIGLCYVTEGENNDIIFTGEGGVKLWEEYEEHLRREAEYRPLVAEGRTWWYCSENTSSGASYLVESGFRIGGEVEINSVKWNRIEKILSRESVGGRYVYDDIPVLNAYIREDSRKRVYVMSDGDCTLFGGLGSYGKPWWTGEGEALVYDFGETGEWFQAGTETGNGKFRITGTKDVENTGTTYRRITSSNYDRNNCFPGETYEYFEGIGIGDGNGSMLFFHPLGGGPAAVGNGPARLRYVTEGEDNGIIFTGEGGVKLWEEYAGIGSIEADGEESPRPLVQPPGNGGRQPDSPRTLHQASG